MRLRDHPVRWAVGAAALGGLAALGMALSGALPSTGPALPHPVAASTSDPAAAEAFLGAWRAHLMGSWSVDELDERTTTAGKRISFEVHDAQSPPYSVLVGNGTVAARQGELQVACGPGSRGQPYACRSVPAARTWAQDVDQQLAALRADLVGPGAVYAVRAAGAGCWSLVLLHPAQTSVIAGRGATFCLDLATGALRSSEVQRDGAIDRVTVVTTHVPATAADLALPTGASA